MPTTVIKGGNVPGVVKIVREHYFVLEADNLEYPISEHHPVYDLLLRERAQEGSAVTMIFGKTGAVESVTLA